MDLYDPPPRETQQRFHAISNPSVTFGSLAFDGFPNDENFRLGSVSFDEAGIVGGGDGIAPNTALSLGVGTDPADSGYVNYGRGSPTNTFVDSFAGTVTLAGGLPTAINLTSSVHLVIPFLGDLQAPGTFTITGNHFDGYLASGTPGSGSQLIWDFGGTLTTVTPVPEPSTWVLASTGLLGLAIVRYRRRQAARV